MKSATKQFAATFVKESKLISKPGAIMRVREPTLTDFGLRAITSGSVGIRQGAREDSGPPAPMKKMVST
ncbi:sulfatase [Achromobacter spanius]|uniref:sulfatase n=1 Tax=Achromobacter spanius TaxID=217203 RepID=UPI0032081BF7